MLRNVVEPIVRVAGGFQHISILQGTKIYGRANLHRSPSRHASGCPHATTTFFFDHETTCGRWEPSTVSPIRHCAATRHRATPGALNVLPAIGVYAASAARWRTVGFRRPVIVWERPTHTSSGCDGLAPARSPQAANEAFNRPTVTFRVSNV